MTNHYHKGPPLQGGPEGAERLLAEIEAFVRGCSEPAVLEAGDEPFALLPGRHSWEINKGRLHLSAWPGERSINRRVILIECRKPGRLVCVIERFGGRTGRLSVLDLAHPRAAQSLLTGERQTFSEVFRRLLNRQFPGWDLPVLTTGMSLQKSFSPKYPRAVMERGRQRIAAMACPSPADEHQFLSFALLWHDHVCGGVVNHEKLPLVLVLPESAGNVTALRLKWLRVPARVFRFNEHGSAGEIDLADLGNLDTRIVSRTVHPEALEYQILLRRLAVAYGVEAVQEPDGTINIHSKGLAFARIRGGVLSCGAHPQTWHQADEAEVERLASYFAASQQVGGPAEHARKKPEHWLESAIRNNIAAIDPALEGQPVWSQVITFAAADRDILDLLSASRNGDATVIEVKVDEDIHLPLQALDYWMRVQWHILNGELDQFFRGIPLRREAPKLVLVAPALRFHPSNEIVLSYFDQQIETERIGLNLEWQQGLQVAFRLRGRDKPLSHRSCQ